MVDHKKDKKGSSGGNSPEPVVSSATESALESTTAPEIVSDEPEVESVSQTEQSSATDSGQPTPPETPEESTIPETVAEPVAAPPAENVRYAIGDVVHHPVYGRCLVRVVEDDGYYHVDSDRYPSQIKVAL